jgi:3-oxoacyl-[acyl-carrier protein] reductase
LVTGANCGIGAAVAAALADEGAFVLATWLRLPAEAHRNDPAFAPAYDQERSRDGAETVRGIRSAGGRAVGLEADLADKTVIPKLFDLAEKESGPIEILVHCASGWVADSFHPGGGDRFGFGPRLVSAELHDGQFAVDARAGALLMAEFARRHVAHRARWGRIVAFTSGGPEGFPQEVSYGAAKAALENYVKSAAAELFAHGVTANIVYPPVTDTGWISPRVREEVTKAGLRIAPPQEVADAVVMLMSERARHVTGSLIRMR